MAPRLNCATGAPSSLSKQHADRLISHRYKANPLLPQQHLAHRCRRYHLVPLPLLLPSTQLAAAQTLCYSFVQCSRCTVFQSFFWHFVAVGLLHAAIALLRSSWRFAVRADLEAVCALDLLPLQKFINILPAFSTTSCWVEDALALQANAARDGVLRCGYRRKCASPDANCMRISTTLF